MATRHRSRFSNLEAQFRAAGGIAAPGSALAKYVDYKSGKTKVDRRKAALTAAQKTRFGIGVVPFNIAPTAPLDNTDRYLTSVTAYSSAGATALGLSPTELGWEAGEAVTAAAQNNTSYFPALIKPAVKGTVEDKTATSKITGNKYYYKEHNSYGLPFGRTTTGFATDTEEGRRKVLSSKARAGTTKATSVGYEPEVWRGEKTPLAPLPTA